MATKLTKNVVRELLATDERGRTIIVTMEAGDMISFRLKGKRQRYEVSLHSAYVLAMAQHLESDYRRKMDEHKAGIRKRKPRPVNLNTFHRTLRAALGK